MRAICFVISVGVLILPVGCMNQLPNTIASGARLIPAEEFSRSVHNGNSQDFSIFRAATQQEAQRESQEVLSDRNPDFKRAQLRPQPQPTNGYAQNADPRYLQRGWEYKQSKYPQSPRFALTGEIVGESASNGPRQFPHPPTLAGGDVARFAKSQLTTNPSLWPDEAQGGFLFSDFRAHQPMDVITIMVNESSTGKKTADTETKSEFDLTTGIAELFGIETTKWTANNTSLDPANLITANTDTEYKGEGDTERTGELQAKLSAVIMEVLPNGLLRIEGTKIISLNNEEEILVLSGLVRTRDISAENTVDSSRIANVRIDFYGRGILAEQTTPGWGARIFEYVWPF